MTLESDKPIYEAFLAAGHAPTLDARGDFDNEYVDERGAERFGVKCRLCGFGLDLGYGYPLETSPLPACDGTEGLLRRLGEKRDHYRHRMASVDREILAATPDDGARKPTDLWLTGGPQPPRQAAEDVANLAGLMAEGPVRGYVVAFLRDDATCEMKLGGDLKRWAPPTLRDVAWQVEDGPRIEAEVARLFAENGTEPPVPRGDPDLTARQRYRLAEACGRVLRVALERPTCS